MPAFVVPLLSRIREASPTGLPGVCYDPSERHLRTVPIILWGGKVISEHLQRDTPTCPRRYRNDPKVTSPSNFYIVSFFYLEYVNAKTLVKDVAFEETHDNAMNVPAEQSGD